MLVAGLGGLVAGALAKWTAHALTLPFLVRIDYEVNDTASVTGFIRHGLAVGLLPASLFENQDGITLVPVRGRAPQFLTAIAVPSNRRPTAASRALLQTLRLHEST